MPPKARVNLPRCAHPGCGRRIPIVAWRNLDPYCSRACCMTHLETPGWEDVNRGQRWADRQFDRKSQDSSYAA